MASERLSSAQDLLDLTFQSLAMQHMDLKQVELDSAVAKVDELSRQLESLWSDSPGPPKEQFRTLSPRSLLLDPPDFLGETLGVPNSPRGPPQDRAPSPRPKVLAVPYEGLALPSPGGGGTGAGGGGRAPSPRLHRPYELLGFGGGSPRIGEGVCAPPAPPPYELQGLYPTIWAQDDSVLKRRPQKSWNESDLDVAYEKKPPNSGGYERTTEGQPGARPPPLSLALAPWRESSLDGHKDGTYGGGHSATLPRNYKVSPLAGGGRGGGGPFRRSAPTPPGARGWPQSQQPVSRIPVPPPAGRPPPRHKPLPLSVIFKLQNAFWEQGGWGGEGGAGGGFRGLPLGPSPSPSPPPSAASRGPQKLPPLPQGPPPALPGEAPSRADPSPGDAEPELERFLQGGGLEGDPLSRPLSPTRLQPVLPPEAQRDPEFGEVARVLAQMPRPLKRRGSMEQSPGALVPPPRSRQYRQLISRLLHRAPAPRGPLPGFLPFPSSSSSSSSSPPGDAPEAPTPAPPTPEPLSPCPVPQELRSALRDPSCPRRRAAGAHVRLDPLVLLLDAALSGELDVVQQAVAELQDPSQPNEEGITALHNAICGANHHVVQFLIASGADVNSPDSHGWTPLHCAASCNDTSVCVALVRHGAAVFASTGSDGSLALDKCDPYRDGYVDCYSYLSEVEQSMGVQNSGVVYALWDYSAALGDELSFREGEAVTVLRRQHRDELDWWWGSLYGHEGLVPRNYFGLFPRVRPQRKKE
ncbi:LOW QUALITY PROTEIN: relA-associated inhibitor [Colius striatus]|uniref:LOW QUALITY PROTEIN: relA-associated inhibitor n=1 Tax=Colius striatus TaxID=57412 RepID=UPI002B1D9189|nr:LOW QUALITY PROTEIN: relA-associated inhibitor [Colius striatus]